MSRKSSVIKFLNSKILEITSTVVIILQASAKKFYRTVALNSFLENSKEGFQVYLKRIP